MTKLEYKDLRVPLDVWAKASAGPMVSKEQALRQAAINASPQATRMIAEVLGVEGASGWQPEGPTDLAGLLLAGRVVWRQTGGIMFSWKFTFDSVTLRFQRSRVARGFPTGMPARLCDRCEIADRRRGAFSAPLAAQPPLRRPPAKETHMAALDAASVAKRESDVRVLVSGQGAYICDECLRLNQQPAAQVDS